MARSLNQKVTPFYIKTMPGMNTRLEPEEQAENYVVKAQNARFEYEYGAVKKREPLRYYNSTRVSTAAMDGVFRFYKSDSSVKLVAVNNGKAYVGDDSAGTLSTEIRTLSTSGKKPSFTVYKDLLIVTDGYNNPWVYDGLSTNTTWELGSCKAALLAGGSNLDAAATYYYAVTIDEDKYICGAVSNTVTTDAGNRKVTLTNIPLGPAGTVDRRIYRTIGGGSTLYLIATIAGNSTTTYVDDIADTTATAMPSVTDDMPVGAIGQVHRERFFLTGNPTFPNRAYFSDPFLPHFIQHVTNTTYINIEENDGDEIMGLPVFMGVMICIKKNSIRIVHTTGPTTGYDPNQWYAEDPHVFSGTPAMYSITQTPYGIIYLGWDGWYLYTNSPTPIISEFDEKEILPDRYKDVVAFWHKNTLYASYTDAATARTYNDMMMVFEFKLKKLSVDTVGASCFTSYSGDDEKGELVLGSSSDGYVYKAEDSTVFYSLQDTVQIAAGTSLDVYKGTDFDGNPYLTIGADTTPAEIPDGVCIFWDNDATSPGAGWTEVTGITQYLRISTGTIAVTGGDGAHVHALTSTTGTGNTAYEATSDEGTDNLTLYTHTHGVSGNSSSGTNILRYVSLRIFKRDKAGGAAVYVFPVGSLCLWATSTMPSGWSLVSGYNGYYIKQGTSSLLTPVAGGHSHTFSLTTDAATYPSDWYWYPSGTTDVASLTHTHAVTGSIPTELEAGEADYAGFALIKKYGNNESTEETGYIYTISVAAAFTGWTDDSTAYNGRCLKILDAGVGTGALNFGAHHHGTTVSATVGAVSATSHFPSAEPNEYCSAADHVHASTVTIADATPTVPYYNVKLVKKVLSSMLTYNAADTAQYANGLWESPGIQLNPASFVSLIWNETLLTNTDITIFTRTGASEATVENGTACTVDNTTEVITSAGHGLINGDRVTLQAGTIPTGASKAVMYYVVEKADNTFKISLSLGGGSINMTSNGVSVTWKKWSAALTNANGSTITSTAAAWFQYAIVMTATDTRTANPTLDYSGGYLLRLEYSRSSTTAESSVEFIYELGFRNFDSPLVDKIFKKLVVAHEINTSATSPGSVEIFWETENGENTFTVDLDNYPSMWSSFFHANAMGAKINLRFTKNDLQGYMLKEIQGVYTPQPLVC